MRESRHEYFDKEPTKVTLEMLTKERLALCYGTSYSHKILESDGVITGFSMSPKQYVATVAGVLMFYDEPQQFIPEAMVVCTEFSGDSGRNIVQTRELMGPIPELIHKSMVLVNDWLQRYFELQDSKLMGKVPVPMEALREAIANALLHRKYTIPSAVKIAIYENRLEIFSPGGFPGLVDIKNLGDGTTYLRNPHLAMLARRHKIIEKLGTGIRLIFDACRQAGIKQPKYCEDGDFVKVIFYFEPSLDVGDSDEDIILKLFEIYNKITATQVAETLNVSRNTATRKLNKLIEKQWIVREGHGPSVKYFKERNLGRLRPSC